MKEKKVMDADSKKRIWGQAEPLLREFKSLVGQPRAQTHRATLGCTIATLLLPLVETPAAAPAKPAPAPKVEPPPPIPPSWRRGRVGKAPWNGLCRRCREKGIDGQLVAYSPQGRPSTWQHLMCPMDEVSVPTLF